VLVRLVGAALALAALSACGNDGGAGTPDRAAIDRDPVAAAQDRLAGIERAEIEVRFVAAAGAPDAPGKDVGFTLEGPFQLPKEDGDLPVASLRSTRLLGDRSIVSTFVSTGTRAWVVADGGKAVELQGARLDALRRSSRAAGADLTALHLSTWFATRKVTKTEHTITVTGTLDAPAAMADVVALSGGAGGDQATLEPKDAERLRSLVRSSHVELVADRDDATLRSLHFDVHFAPEDQPRLAEVLPGLAGVDLRLDLGLAHVGEAVHVTPPKGG
jgi:hypothetical protein